MMLISYVYSYISQFRTDTSIDLEVTGMALRRGCVEELRRFTSSNQIKWCYVSMSNKLHKRNSYKARYHRFFQQQLATGYPGGTMGY
jgi:hypothetical protein